MGRLVSSPAGLIVGLVVPAACSTARPGVTSAPVDTAAPPAQPPSPAAPPTAGTFEVRVLVTRSHTRDHILSQYVDNVVLSGTAVTVLNTPPTVDAGPGASILESDPFDSGGSFTDPDADSWTATVDYGDSGGVEPLALNPDKTFDLSHTYGDNGTYTVTVCVRDDDGETTCDTLDVTVENVAPVLTFDTSSAIAFGDGPAFLGRRGVPQDHGASASDVGSDDLTFRWSFPPDATAAETTYRNNPAEPDPLPSPHGTFPFSAGDSTTVDFALPGVHTVVVSVTDDDGDSDGDELIKLVTDDCDCAKTIGFWRHQFRGRGNQQIDDVTLAAYLGVVNFASAVFSEQVAALTLTDANATQSTPCVMT